MKKQTISVKAKIVCRIDMKETIRHKQRISNEREGQIWNAPNAKLTCRIDLKNHPF